MSRPVGGGFRRRREAEDPNNTWNMQLFTALLTKNFSEASNLLEKGANVNHMTANIISTNSSGSGAGSGFDGASSPQQGGSPLGNNNSPGSPTGANLDNNNNNKQGGNNNNQQAQSPQALALQQHQQKLVATFLKSGGTVPLCIALIFRASGVANYGEASPGGVSPATIPIADAIESLSWLYQNGCNLNAVVEPFATLSANQLQQLQQNNMPPTMTALQRSVNGTMFHMCVHFEWSETLEKLLALRIKLDYQQKQTEQPEQQHETTEENAEQQGDENNSKKSKPEYLLSAGVVDRNGSSPSLLAVTSGKIEIAKILLRHLAPFDFLQKVDQEHTLLGRAAATNDVVLVEILLQLGDDPDQVDIETGKTLLQLTWSAFNRQDIDPSLVLPSGTQVIGSTAAGGGGGGGAGTGKSGAQGAHTAINVFNPSQLLQQQQQTLSQQQQLLPPSALLSSAAQQGAAGGATTSNSKADKNDPNAGLQMQLMNVLLNRGYDINKPNVEGKTLMTNALDTLPRHLALSHLDTFVQNGGNIDAADAVTGRTLLMASVDTCDIELMRKLILDYKADVNARDAFGASALHRACGCGRRIGLAEQLLAYEQTNINLQDFDGQAPLHRAAARGRESTVKMLIGKEACDVNVADEDGNTPLHVAVEGGHFPIVELLVSLNTNPRPVSAGNKRGGGGGGGGGNKKKEQVEPNPNRLTVDAVNKDGHTALELAVKKMMEQQQSSESTETVLKIVDKLMSGSASVHRVSADTKLSLLQQAVIARSSSLVDTFLSKNANIHHRCAKDKTALHYATENQDVQIVKNLLQGGAVVNAQDSFRLTAPLHIACADLHVELATIFVEQAGANVNITNDNFQTPLHIVCDCAGGDDTTPIRSNIGFVPSSSSSGSNHAETLERATAIGRLLLSKGARGNCADRWRRTPLHYAAASNAVDLFRELLVKLSHQVWIKDENESTALHLACSHKATNVVEFICGLMETRHKTHHQNQNQNNNIVPRTSKEIVLVLENLIAQGQEKIAAGSSRAVKAGAAYARPSDPLIQMHRKKFDVENPIEGAASTAARNILEAEDISNELEGWKTGLKMKDKMGRTAMLLAAQAGSSEIGKLLSATQKILM